MKPADQTVMADIPNGIYGDCQRAVIASLLELPIEEVPHFLQDANGDPDGFYTGIQSFCRSHGFVYVTAYGGVIAFGDDGDIYHSISGPSPRGQGMHHAVVGRNGEIAHDPHPSRAGLLGNPGKWTCNYMVKA